MTNIGVASNLLTSWGPKVHLFENLVQGLKGDIVSEYELHFTTRSIIEVKSSLGDLESIKYILGSNLYEPYCTRSRYILKGQMKLISKQKCCCFKYSYLLIFEVTVQEHRGLLKCNQVCYNMNE